jgi:AraC-like DNA-binding protein
MPTFLVPAPHQLRFYDILLVTSGSGSFRLDGVAHAVAPGRVFFTSPGQVRVWQVEGLDGLCLFFPAVFLAEFFNDAAFLERLPYFHVPDGGAHLTLPDACATRMRHRLGVMRRELHRWSSDSAHLVRALLYRELFLLARAFARSHGVPQTRPVHRITSAFRELVSRYALRQQRITWYAAELGVSPQHLNRLTRAWLGASAKDLLQARLEVEARRLLSLSDDSVGQIGDRLGFRDASYFARFFKQRTGQAPSAYRKQMSQRVSVGEGRTVT